MRRQGIQDTSIFKNMASTASKCGLLMTYVLVFMKQFEVEKFSLITGIAYTSGTRK